MKQKDILIKQQKDKLEKLSDDIKVPNGYFKVNLMSRGKLGYPEYVHVRDYSLEEILDLSIVGYNPDIFENELETLEAFLKVLDKMVYEKDFNVLDLHQNDLITLLLTLKMNVSVESAKLYDREYFYNPDLKDDDLNKEENIGKIDVDLNRLELRKIKDNFKQPFMFTDKKSGKKIVARLQKISDLLLAGKKVMKEFKEENEKFEDVKNDLVYNKKIDDMDISDQEKIDKKKKIPKSLEKEFFNYAKRRVKKQLAYTRMQVIEKIDDLELKNFDEKISHISDIPFTFWEEYNRIIEDEYEKFGVIEDYTFRCPVLKKTITRRFQFRPLDFIPDDKEKRTEQYDFSFDF